MNVFLGYHVTYKSKKQSNSFITDHLSYILLDKTYRQYILLNNFNTKPDSLNLMSPSRVGSVPSCLDIESVWAEVVQGDVLGVTSEDELSQSLSCCRALQDPPAGVASSNIQSFNLKWKQ